jgi:hypothetical protein
MELLIVKLSAQLSFLLLAQAARQVNNKEKENSKRFSSNFPISPVDRRQTTKKAKKLIKSLLVASRGS